MNETLNSIHKRRSVRAYESKKVPRDIIETIIDAANNAPSGMNSQPWRFVVIEDDALHRQMLEAAVPNAKTMLEPLKESNPERYQMIMKRYEELDDPIYYGAPAIIFVIGTDKYADMSCPLACQNIMLSAYSLGLGSCWVAFGSLITDNEEITKSLELKEGEKIFGPILVGYPKGDTVSPDKKPPIVKWI